MKIFKLSFILICLSFLTAKAQYPTILISSSNDPEEVSIAINPKNTNQIIAGANLNNRYKSNDGGLTWQAGILTCNAYSVYGDPVVFWDTLGSAYFMHLSNPNPSITPGGTWVDRIVIQKSTDAGATYPICKATGKSGTKVQDKPWHVVSPFDNSIHITWTQFDAYESSASADSSHIMYSHSLDGGLTWSAPLRINHQGGNCMDNDTTVEGAVPAIGPSGEVYVVWASLQGLRFQKSVDNGLTWMPSEKLIGTINGGWVYDVGGLMRCNGLPFTQCDLSQGPNRGTIYVNYSDQTNGINDVDVYVIKSTDGGTTWSSPIRVNNDVPGKNQFMSSMTVDQATGYVYVIFYDRRNYTGSNLTDVYVAISKDGGNTFSNHKINQTSFNPTSTVFFGDYIGISAHNNKVRPIWMQLNGGALSVFTANLDALTLTGIPENEKSVISIITPQPNPFSSQTKIIFNLTKKQKVTAQLVDASGKIIKELVTDKLFSKGKHDMVIDKNENNLTKGLYYLVLYGEAKSEFVKLIVE